jgi:uncharacterized protein YkwD
MKKITAVIIFILIFSGFSAGIYFKENILKFLDYAGSQINIGINDFQKTEIGSLITKAQKEIFTPYPLNIGGANKEVVLLKSKIIEETNLQRKNNGLPELKENTALEESALAKANDMFKNQYFEHTSPEGISSGDLVQSFGYEYIVTGENLILGNFKNEAELVESWMNSPGHRENILNSRYTDIGISVVQGNYEGHSVWISVQEFGFPLSVCDEPDSGFKNQIDGKKTNLDQLGLSIDQKKAQIEAAYKNTAYYSQMINDYNLMVQDYNNLAEMLKEMVLQYNNQVNTFNGCVKGQ